MNVSIIGAGYVGLVTGASLAELGHNVAIMDVDEAKIARLNRGVVPIHEPGLSRMIEKNRGEGRISFTASLEEATKDAQIHTICVWTPPMEDGRADLSAILSVAEALGIVLQKQRAQNPVIVTKSTVPVGTGKRVTQMVRKNFSGIFSVASNPEFLREGRAVADMMHPDRIVVGSDDPQAAELVSSLYADLAAPKIITDLPSAEMIKYAANAFLATKISFINEVANVCERVGADIDAVKEGIGSDKRIGSAHLYPGMGYGGSCFPKDVRALQQFANHQGYDFKLLKSVIEVNEQQRQLMVEKLRLHLGDLSGKLILVLGLAFKENTDDVRESAGIDLINRIRAQGARVRAHDPIALLNAQKVLDTEIEYITQPHEGARDVDAVVVATEWPQFRELDWPQIKQNVKNPLVLDGRNLLDPAVMKGLGFTYEGFGRK